MFMDNWRPGRTGLDGLGPGWATEPGSGCVCFACVTVRCMDPSQVTDLLSRAYTCLWGQEDLFLFYHGFRLFPDRLFRWLYILGWGGLSTILRPGLQCWRLRVRAWTRTWTPWQEWNRFVLLVPGVQARRVFSGHPARHIDGTAWLRSGIVVRIGSWKMKK
jgi:hypothetical protein